MPDWQIVIDANARLQQVRAIFDSAVTEAIQEANAGALPVLELLADEAERHTRGLLAAFVSTPVSSSP